MARTKQTARKSTGGKAPRRLQIASTPAQFRSFMTGRQRVDHGTKKKVVPKKGRGGAIGAAGSPMASGSEPGITSYLNYENMFYSYAFPTGARPSVMFEPRFVAGQIHNPVTTKQEHWLGLNLNSMYDGTGMEKHGRPNVNLVIVLDISGSMSCSMGERPSFEFGHFGGGGFETKLGAAKKCLHSIVAQLKNGDSFGLVLFNHDATVKYKLQPIGKIPKQSLATVIDKLVAGGMTDLSKAARTALKLFEKAPESAKSSNRVLFLTDLNSTVDSANDEAQLLQMLRTAAETSVYTSIVGIGMDLNVRLVEQISSTRGARYLSVDSADEFQRLMEKEFSYDVTVIAFNIQVTVKSKGVTWVKGHGSPEINDIKKNKPAKLSSEFPCWQDDKGHSKGGIMVFKLEPNGKNATMPSSVEVSVQWDDSNGISHSKDFSVKIADDDKVDKGLRKAVAIIHYVDLVNDYVMDQRTHKVKFLELFQGFRPQFLSEMEKSGDDTLKSTNQGDLELLDKIISLETPGSVANTAADQQDGCTPFSPFQGIKQRVGNFVSGVRSAFSPKQQVATVVPMRTIPAATTKARPGSRSSTSSSLAPAKSTKKTVQFQPTIPRSRSAAATTTKAAVSTKQVGQSKRTTAAATKARVAAGQRRRPAAKPKASGRKKSDISAAAATTGTAKKPAATPTRAASTRGTTAKQQTGKAVTTPAKKAGGGRAARKAAPPPKQSPPKAPVTRKRPASRQLQQPASRKREKK